MKVLTQSKRNNFGKKSSSKHSSKHSSKNKPSTSSKITKNSKKKSSNTIKNIKNKPSAVIKKEIKSNTMVIKNNSIKMEENQINDSDDDDGNDDDDGDEVFHGFKIHRDEDQELDEYSEEYSNSNYSDDDDEFKIEKDRDYNEDDVEDEDFKEDSEEDKNVIIDLPPSKKFKSVQRNDKLSSKKSEVTSTTVTAAKSTIKLATTAVKTTAIRSNAKTANANSNFTRRKGSKFDDDFRMELLKNWNLARNIKLEPEEKKKHLKHLFELIKGKIPEILFKHDTSRIIQTCLKYGSKEQRKMIAKELEGKFVEASKNLYSKFVIQKILRYCPEFKNKIVLEFKGSVTKLIQHRFAHDVILELYECLNAKQRNSLIHEFYGPEFNLFKEAKDKTMSELIKENPSNKEKILRNLSSTIDKLLKKPGLIGYIISHRILLDYFTYADDTNDNQVQEKIQFIGKHISEILHTQEGSRVAMHCLAYGSVKAMKEHIEKIACEEYGYLVLLRAFDVVDDTVIVAKYIIEKMVKSDDKLKQIIENKWGHRVILYLLVGRSKIYFSHETLKLLGEGDEIRKSTSKKDPIIRANELCKHISPALINYSKHNTDKMLSNPYATQILCETLLHAIASTEEKQQIFENIAKIASKPPPNDINSSGEADNDDHIMLSYVNRTLKVLVQGQHWRIDKFQECSEKTNLNFAPILFNGIKDHISVYARHPSASYVILALLKDSNVGSEVKNTLKKNLENFRSSALADEKSGPRLILTELNELQIEGIGDNKDESNENKSMSKGKKRKKND